MNTPPIIFITGTDTGVGKTLLSSLLVVHLRARGLNALPLKPYCCGNRDDVRLLHKACGGAATLKDINPYFFSRPLAPLAAVSDARKLPGIQRVVDYIHKFSMRSDVLVIEGCGGLFVPLGPGFFVTGLLASLNAATVLVAPNKLGTINHTLLSLKAIEGMSQNTSVVLMGQAKPDLSAKTNQTILARFLPSGAIFSLPRLDCKCLSLKLLREIERKFEKTLAEVVYHTYFPRRSLEKIGRAPGKEFEKILQNRLTLKKKFIK